MMAEAAKETFMDRHNISNRVAATEKMFNTTDVNKLTTTIDSLFTKSDHARITDSIIGLENNHTNSITKLMFTKPDDSRITASSIVGVADTLAHTAKVTGISDVTRAAGKHF